MSVPAIDLEPRTDAVFDTGKHQFFSEPGLDTLTRVVVELAAEVWVLRDRNRVLETVLAQAGRLDRDLVESYQPSPEELQEALKERDTFVARILSPIAELGAAR
jgi:hypothetical protein